MLLTLLLVGAFLVSPVVAQSRVTRECPSQPSDFRVTYKFDFTNGTIQNVCISSSLDPNRRIDIWVFSPSDGVEINYTITTITGPTPQACVFNNTELSVARPNASNGTFSVTLVSQQGQSAALLVNYVPRGIYNEVQEVSLPSTQPIWRAIGIRDFLSLNVCRVDGPIPFLQTIVPSFSPCLNGRGDIDPFYVMLVAENTPNAFINQPLSVHLVTGTCEDPGISSPLVTITIRNAMTTSTPPTPAPTPSPSPTVTAPPTIPGGISGGGIAGIVLGVLGVLVLLALIFLSFWFGIPHLKRSGGRSHSRRQSRTFSVEEGTPSLDEKLEVEQRVGEGGQPVDVVQPVQNVRNTPPPEEQRYAPPPPSQTTNDKFIVVMTPFQELANELSNKHRLRLKPPEEETRVPNGYSQRVYSALFDDNCQAMYFIWSHSLEEASKVAVPPMSELVRELVSRPHSATDLKKVVFVQLGSKSTVPLSTLIHQFSLESSPSDEHFNVQECAKSIYEKVCDLERSDDDFDAGDMVARTTRTVENEVTPTGKSPPRSTTPPPTLPPSYSAVVSTEDHQPRSLPASVEPVRAVERVRATTLSSADSSPLTGLVEASIKTNIQLLEEFRGFRQQYASSSEKNTKKLVNALQEDQRTVTDKLHTVNSKVETVDNKVETLGAKLETVEGKVEGVHNVLSTVDEKTDKLQDAVGDVLTHIQQTDDDLQDLREHFDEATLVQESPRENQMS